MDTEAWIYRDPIDGTVEYRLNVKKKGKGIAFRLVAHTERELLDEIRRVFFPFFQPHEMEQLVREWHEPIDQTPKEKNDELKNWDDF